jgi:hypothetical protein
MSRAEILASLADAVEPDAVEAHVSDRLNEITLKGVAKAAAVGGAFYLALKQWKLPPPSKFSRRVSALEYAKRLVQAKNNKETVTASVGLLNIIARVLLQVPELRDLGYRIMKVVQSERLEDYFDDE